MFEGQNVPERRWRGFRAHAVTGELRDLCATFGAAQDFEQHGDRAFFTLPTHWTGLVEPFKVTRSALQNAASIGALVLTTETLIADKPEPKKDAMPAGGGGMGGYDMM